jgi:hypothetical protein
MSGLINSAGSKSGVIGTTELDYEEGTWTPALADNTSGSYNVSSNGIYTKIGRMVYVQGNIYVTHAGNGSNYIMSGLPFTSGGSGQAGYLSTGYFYNIATAKTVFNGTIFASSSTINWYAVSGTYTDNRNTSVAVFQATTRFDFSGSYTT